MKKRKPPKRPATPTKDKDNSSRLAAMKLKLKAELKKQTEVVVPKKKHQDFLGLGYTTKESKALEDTVTSRQCQCVKFAKNSEPAGVSHAK